MRSHHTDRGNRNLCAQDRILSQCVCVCVYLQTNCANNWGIYRIFNNRAERVNFTFPHTRSLCIVIAPKKYISAKQFGPEFGRKLNEFRGIEQFELVKVALG